MLPKLKVKGTTTCTKQDRGERTPTPPMDRGREAGTPKNFLQHGVKLAKRGNLMVSVPRVPVCTPPHTHSNDDEAGRRKLQGQGKYLRHTLE